MYLHSKDSLTLIKDILTVQEELDKFQAGLASKDYAKISARESKVSPKLHRLRDSKQTRVTQPFHRQDGISNSNIPKQDLSLLENSFLEKSNRKKRVFQFPEEAPPQDFVSNPTTSIIKRPPTKSAHRSSSSTPYETSKENIFCQKTKDSDSRENNLRKRMREQIPYKYTKAIRNDLKEQASEISLAVLHDKMNNKDKKLSRDRSPVKTSKEIHALKERTGSQSISQANVMNYAHRSLPNSCEMSRDYGIIDKSAATSHKTISQSCFKRHNSVLPESVDLEYNGTFAPKNGILSMQSPPSKLVAGFNSHNNVENGDSSPYKETSAYKKRRNKSTNIYNSESWDFLGKSNREIDAYKEREKRKTSQETIRTGRPSFDLSSLPKENELGVQNIELRSTRDSDNRKNVPKSPYVTLDRRILGNESFKTIHGSKSEYDQLLNEFIIKRKRASHGSLLNSVVSQDENYDHSRSFMGDEGVLEIIELLRGEKAGGRSRDDNEDRSQLLKMIMDLKNQVHEKDLEILEMKNKRVSEEIENRGLQMQVSEALKMKKKNEDGAEKLQHQVECQEREIEFLKKCKQRLEENLKSNNKASSELKEFTAKISKYEETLQDKYQEALDFVEKLKKVEDEAGKLKEKNSQLELVVEDLEKNLKQKDVEIGDLKRDLQNRIKKIEEYRMIEGKLGEVEDLQNQLIRENGSLKDQLIDSHQKSHQLEVEIHEKNKEATDRMIETNKKLKDINDYTRRLVEFLEALSKGEEPPIELFLKHNRGLRIINSGKYGGKTQEYEYRQMTIKELSQSNLAVVEVVQNTYIDCMDRMCETYAMRYGNECSVQ